MEQFYRKLFALHWLKKVNGLQDSDKKDSLSSLGSLSPATSPNE